MEFKVGDKVKCVNSGSGYSTHTSMAKTLKLKNWEYHSSMSNGEIGKIIAISGIHCGVRVKDRDYIIGAEGLKSVGTPKNPTHLVVWEVEVGGDPCEFFTDEKKAKEFVKELSEKSDVRKDSIILVEIKSAQKVNVIRNVRLSGYKI